jgi:xanthine/uracil permease
LPQVFGLIILIELFGSPFMRSAAIVFALVIGTAVSAIATVDGKRLFNGAGMTSAPAVTFLWVKRFPLGEFKTV